MHFSTENREIVTLKYPQRSHSIKTNWTISFTNIYFFSPIQTLKAAAASLEKRKEKRNLKKILPSLRYTSGTFNSELFL